MGRLLKNGEDGAHEGAVYVKKCLIQVTHRAIDDFAGTKSDVGLNRRILGL